VTILDNHKKGLHHPMQGAEVAIALREGSNPKVAKIWIETGE
jgi:hypothetical protein